MQRAAYDPAAGEKKRAASGNVPARGAASAMAHAAAETEAVSLLSPTRRCGRKICVFGQKDAPPRPCAPSYNLHTKSRWVPCSPFYCFQLPGFSREACKRRRDFGVPYNKMWV